MSRKESKVHLFSLELQSEQVILLPQGLEAAYDPSGLVHCALLLQAGRNNPQVLNFI